MARQRLTDAQRKARQNTKSKAASDKPGFFDRLFRTGKAGPKASTGKSELGGSAGRAINRRNERMNASPESPASNTPVAMERTKGGNYPQYTKNTPKAQSFRDAFASARKDGKEKFSWEGREYTTEVAKKSGGKIRGYGMARGGKVCKMR